MGQFTPSSTAVTLSFSVLPGLSQENPPHTRSFRKESLPPKSFGPTFSSFLTLFVRRDSLPLAVLFGQPSFFSRPESRRRR